MRFRFSLGTLLLLPLLAGSLHLLNLRKAAWRQILVLPERAQSLEKVSPYWMGGRMFFAGEQQGQIVIWDTRSPRTRSLMLQGTPAIQRIVVSGDGRVLLVGETPAYSDQILQMYFVDAATGERISRVASPSVPEDKWLLTPTGHQAIRVRRSESPQAYDRKTGLLAQIFQVQPLTVDVPIGPAILYDNGRRLLASVYDANVVNQWDVDTGQLLTPKYDANSFVYDLRVSADFKRAWCSNKGGDAIFDLDSGQHLEGYPSVIHAKTSLAQTARQQFFRDNDGSLDRMVCSISPDGTRFIDSSSNIHDAVTLSHLDQIAAQTISFRALFLDDDHILQMDGPTFSIWERQRPERWWGLFLIFETWLVIALLVAIAWCIRRDRLKIP